MDLATVTPIAPAQSPTTRRLELIDAVYHVALASGDELELAATALDPYDVNRIACIFARVDEANAAL